jgi:hypothetical protein
MKIGRGYFLANFVVASAGARAMWAGCQRQTPPTQPQPTPGTRRSNNSQEDVPLPPIADPKVQLKESQKNLRLDPDHLLQLANELKYEACETEQTNALSLSLIHTAEEVEELARHIEDLVSRRLTLDSRIDFLPA